MSEATRADVLRIATEMKDQNGTVNLQKVHGRFGRMTNKQFNSLVADCVQAGTLTLLHPPNAMVNGGKPPQTKITKPKPWSVQFTGSGLRIDDAKGQPILFIYGENKDAQSLAEAIKALEFSFSDGD